MHTAKLYLEDAAQPRLEIECSDPNHADSEVCPIDQIFKYDGWDAFRLWTKQPTLGDPYPESPLVAEFPVKGIWYDNEGWVVYDKKD
jgi:hypothetical protein